LSKARASNWEALFFEKWLGSKVEFFLGRNLTQDRLYFFVGVPTMSLALQDQISPHAAASEVFYAFIVLGAVGMRVEVAGAIVADVFEKLYQPECRLQIGRSKTQVLVEIDSAFDRLDRCEKVCPLPMPVPQRA